jgi:hypothetical protein
MSNIKHRRNRGGQAGNQNARKHGFYSKVVTAGQLKKLSQAKTVRGNKQEIAMLRVKIKDILARSPRNTRAFFDAVNILVRLMSLNQ